ncbi:MAG: hypothetical protein V4702_06050 [Patescibacteria group bacterium]
MKLLITKFIIALAFIMSIATLLPAVAYAQNAKANVCEGIGIATGGSNDCTDPAGSPSVDSAVKAGINILSIIVGVVSVVMIIIGGFKYIISSGDSGNITGAKNTILYALVGLVIVALAQVIVKFVLTKSTTVPKCNGTTITTGCTP